MEHAPRLPKKVQRLFRKSVSIYPRFAPVNVNRIARNEYNDSYTCNIIHHYCICHSQDTAFETLLALNYNSFILTLAIIGVGIYSIHEAGEYNVFDSHARDMYHNSHSEGTCVLLEIPSMHKLLQYFQTTLLLILVDTGLKEPYLPLLVTGIHCTM